MRVSIYSTAIETFLPILRNLSEILARGQQHFIASGRNPEELMHVPPGKAGATGL